MQATFWKNIEESGTLHGKLCKTTLHLEKSWKTSLNFVEKWKTSTRPWQKSSAKIFSKNPEKDAIFHIFMALEMKFFVWFFVEMATRRIAALDVLTADQFTRMYACKLENVFWWTNCDIWWKTLSIKWTIKNRSCETSICIGKKYFKRVSSEHIETSDFTNFYMNLWKQGFFMVFHGCFYNYVIAKYASNWGIYFISIFPRRILRNWAVNTLQSYLW